MHIYVDADACPVKEEVYRVARRYALPVTLVANAPQRIPADEHFHLVVVREGMDVADDWIAEHAGEGDIVITADIPLAARCVRNGARVIGTTGRPFTEDNVGGALTTRDILSELRGAGAFTSGPPPSKNATARASSRPSIPPFRQSGSRSCREPGGPLGQCRRMPLVYISWE